MAGIGVEEIKTVKVTTTDGKPLKSGDMICIRVKGQDIVCRFGELDKNSYFVTIPATGGAAVKYRPASIERCYLVKIFKLDTEGQIEPAADGTDAGALAPATE